jgi:ATP-dependent Clp protease ATP-binding subunit ClpA
MEDTNRKIVSLKKTDQTQQHHLKKPNENLIEKIVGQDDAYDSIAILIGR